MSDDMAAPEMEGTDAPEGEAAPAAPAAKPPLGAKPLRPSIRPPLSSKPAGSPRPPQKSSKLKGMLMLSIIIAVVGLSGAIGWRLIARIMGKPPIVIDVGAEIDRAFDRAMEHRKQIELIENQVTIRGQDIGGADAVLLQKHLNGLQECSAKFDDLRILLRDKQQEALKKQGAEAAEAIEKTSDKDKLNFCEIKLKLWILDAMDLLDLSKNAPDYGGLYIPMRRAQQALLKAKTDLSEIETLSDQIVQRNDPAEFARTRERLKAIEAAFAACREKLNNLDKYVMEGLARPELTPKELPELGELRDDAAKAAMSVGQIRQVRAKVRE